MKLGPEKSSELLRVMQLLCGVSSWQYGLGCLAGFFSGSTLGSHNHPGSLVCLISGLSNTDILSTSRDVFSFADLLTVNKAEYWF